MTLTDVIGLRKNYLVAHLYTSQIYTLRDCKDDDGDDDDDDDDDHDDNPDTADVSVFMAVPCLHIVQKTHTRRMNNKHWTTHVDLSVSLRSFPTVLTTNVQTSPCCAEDNPMCSMIMFLSFMLYFGWGSVGSETHKNLVTQKIYEHVLRVSNTFQKTTFGRQMTEPCMKKVGLVCGIAWLVSVFSKL